jgi:biotin carboxyl carrier protein
MRYVACVGEKEMAVEVTRHGPGRYRVIVDGRERAVERREGGGAVLLAIDGRTLEVVVAHEGGGAPGPAGRVVAEAAYAVTIRGRFYPVRLLDPLRRAATGPAALARGGRVDVRSVMPGRIAALLVKEGDRVKAGQGVVVVEAMKMENELPAPKDGRISAVRVRAGETVEAGAVLMSVE